MKTEFKKSPTIQGTLLRTKVKKWVEDGIFEKHDLSLTPKISIETYLLVTLSTNLLSP